MSPALVVAALWIAFAASHMVLSSRALRLRLVAAIGKHGFTVFYSVVAFAIFVPLVMYYFDHRHAGPQLWSLPATGWLLWLVYLVNAVAFVLVAAGLLRPSPSALVGSKTGEPRGAQRWTRHPLMMGIGLWALTHVAVNGFASDFAFFGGFVLFVLLGSWHQDARKLADDDAYRAYCERAPFIPFTRGQIVAGARELGLGAPALGIALTVVLRYLHDAPWP